MKNNKEILAFSWDETKLTKQEQRVLRKLRIDNQLIKEINEPAWVIDRLCNMGLAIKIIDSNNEIAYHISITGLLLKHKFLNTKTAQYYSSCLAKEILKEIKIGLGTEDPELTLYELILPTIEMVMEDSLKQMSHMD